MTRAGAVLVAIVAAAACQGAIDPGPPLQIVGESTKVRRGEPLPSASAIFDGHVVRLRAARGEVLGVQVLRADDAPARIAVHVDGAAVRAWRVDEVHVIRPSTDMWGPSRGAGDYPDRLVGGEADDVIAGRDALFDVAIARDAAPGAHAGTIEIGDARVELALVIEPIDLAPISDAPRVWAYYDAAELARADGLAPGGDDAWAAEQRVAAMFRAYGVLATPELTLADADRRAELVRGARFVPVKLPEGRAAVEADARAWGLRGAQTGQIAFAIPIDEPRSIANKLAVRAIGSWLHAAGGGVWLAVTDGPDWLYGDAVDVLCAPAAPGTGPPDHRWTYNGAPPRAGAMIVDTDGAALRTWGWIGFRHDVPLWYVWDALYWRDRHNARRRGVAKADVPLTDATRDAVTFDDGEDHGNLDGVLAYPHAQPSLRLAALRRGLEDRALLDALAACAGRPVADAIAGRLVPRSLGDLDGEPPGRAGAWPTDEPAWEAARNALLDGLDACAARAPAPH